MSWTFYNLSDCSTNCIIWQGLVIRYLPSLVTLWIDLGAKRLLFGFFPEIWYKLYSAYSAFPENITFSWTYICFWMHCCERNTKFIWISTIFICSCSLEWNVGGAKYRLIAGKQRFSEKKLIFASRVFYRSRVSFCHNRTYIIYLRHKNWVFTVKDRHILDNFTGLRTSKNFFIIQGAPYIRNKIILDLTLNGKAIGNTYEGSSCFLSTCHIYVCFNVSHYFICISSIEFYYMFYYINYAICAFTF